MSTSEIERLVRLALQTDAEEAMNVTDSGTQYEDLVREAERDAQRRRSGFAAGGALLAAAAAVAAAVWWPTADQTDVAPAGPADAQTPAERVATDFVEAYAAFDWAGVRADLAEDADITAFGGQRGVEALRRSMGWDQAVAMDLQLRGCHEAATLADGSAQVGCLYTAHVLHSEELGRGPFGDNIFNLIVRDGEIVVVSDSQPQASNGMWDEMYGPFLEWLQTAHPEDVDLAVAAEDPDASPLQVRRSLALLEVRAREYADAVLAGGAE